MTFDPRLTPARPELAAAHLRGQVDAKRFVEGTLQQVVDAQAPLRQAPAPDAALLTEALMGEHVKIYETTEGGWAWGQLETDNYVGWLPANALATPGPDATHRVAALRTLVFPGPSIKLPPAASLPLGARLAIVRNDGTLAATADDGFVPAQHLASIDSVETDFVAVAERFLGTPYLWGGKASLGLDCSGLVQVALTACGIACPRDSDMQEQALGELVAPNDNFSNLQRGDLVFWKGHVAIVRDAKMLLHASATHMSVVIEPVTEAIARIRGRGSKVTAVRRIAPAA